MKWLRPALMALWAGPWEGVTTDVTVSFGFGAGAGEKEDGESCKLHSEVCGI